MLTATLFLIGRAPLFTQLLIAKEELEEIDCRVVTIVYVEVGYYGE
jgi:hypothetical protein